MENPTPIPIPLKQHWREFRVRYLPVLMFLLLLGGIAMLWSSYVQPSSIIGEVESVHANVVSTVPGTLIELKTDRLQSVTNGQVLAVIQALDPDQLSAELAAAEADLRLMKARMDLDRTRNLDSFAQLKTTLLDARLDLEVSRVRLQQAESELTRSQKLLDEKIIGYGSGTARNDFGYEVALRDRDALRAEVASHESTVHELELAVENLQTNGVAQADPVDEVIEKAIASQRQRIESLNKPIILRSPVDGFVSDVGHRAGERISAGDRVLVVSVAKANRIVAWVHQPVTVHPHVGDLVEVRRMGMGQLKIEATVIQVGSQLEPVSPMLRSPTANPERIEVGLPLLVQSDSIEQLIPGEPVLVRLLPPAATRGD